MAEEAQPCLDAPQHGAASAARRRIPLRPRPCDTPPMSLAPRPEPMTADEFLVWCLDQEERYELVDGYPRLKWPPEGPGMMAGATGRHDQIVVNLISQLRTRLRGGPCRPHTPDLGTRTARSVRRPDVTVDCKPNRPDALETAEPTVLFEVLSKSTRGTDLVRKTDEYQRLPSARHIVILEQAWPKAVIWTRAGDGTWDPQEIDGLDGALELDAIGVRLAMVDVYEDVQFD